MTSTTSAIDHVVILAAKNYNGQSMVQAARKGASPEARDQAARIFVDNVVQKARAEYKKMINGKHDETTASYTLSKGTDHLSGLSQIGLSQESRDYILREYLSIGILENAQEVAEFGASREALAVLREALIQDGEPRGLAKIAARQRVSLQTKEIDDLVNVCLKKHLELNSHILIEAIRLGASRKVREDAARAFIKDRKRNGGNRFMCDWDTLLQILGDCGSGPQDVLDQAVKMAVDDIARIRGRSSGLSPTEYHALLEYTEYGVRLVCLGASAHIADYFVQELVAKGVWQREDAVSVIHRCTPMLAGELTQLTLQRAKANHHDIRTGRVRCLTDANADLKVVMAKLAQMAACVGKDLKGAVIEELLDYGLVNEAVALAGSLEL